MYVFPIWVYSVHNTILFTTSKTIFMSQKDFHDGSLNGCALLVVDLTNDSFPGGGLAVPNGYRVIKPTNRIIQEFSVERKMLTVFTRDWHKPDTKHFKPTGLWNPHNVQNTPGAEFHKDLIMPKGVHILSKGLGDEDAYSAFDPKADIEGITLAEFFRMNDIKRIFVCGLATDYCVKYAVLDALKEGFEVDVLRDAMEAVKPEDEESALQEMEKAGAYITYVDAFC